MRIPVGNFFSRGSMRGEKADGSPSSRLWLRNIDKWDKVRFAIRLTQFVLGLVVIGMYVPDLADAKKKGKYTDSKWLYAIITGSVSSLVSAVYMFPTIKQWLLFPVDTFIWFLWLVVFSIFGKMYIKEDAEGDTKIQRMKNAVWIDVANMLLWFGTATWGAWVFYRYRKARTTLTGQGQMHV